MIHICFVQNADCKTPTTPDFQTDYIKPKQSFDEASNLVGQPLSVTEPTTRPLQIDSGSDAKNFAIKVGVKGESLESTAAKLRR